MFYVNELNKLKRASALRVPVTLHDRNKYKDLFTQNPSVFLYNATKEFYNEMVNHILQGKRWLCNCMGRTRHGKSEVAQTWTMLYIDRFNQALKQGAYNYMEGQGIHYKKQKLTRLQTNQILFSQSNFLYTLREEEKNEEFIYGKPRIIDEDEQKIGGLGSYSEKLEIENVQNITAQALQSEWQLRPDRFVIATAPYGLLQEKMDRKNKINWSMLYELKNEPSNVSLKRYIFKGWIATPLHEDHELRKEYNEMKKENIKKVFAGTGDLRLLQRREVAIKLSENKDFSARSTHGKTFRYSKLQQETVLNEMIMDGDVQNFNSMEKLEIVEYARLIADKKYMESTRKEMS